MRGDKLIADYRTLETILEKKYAGRQRRHSSAVMEYLADPESRPVRDDINLVREIRNIIVHNADSDGGVVVEPSEAVVRSLESAIEYVRRPPLALSFATLSDAILRADIRDLVFPLMRAMMSRGFSHVPVYDDARFVGVFSTGTVFSYLADDPGDRELEANDRGGASPLFDKDTCLTAFRKYIPLEAHEPEKFLFMDEGATYADVKAAFEERHGRNNRLAVVFITSDGTAVRPLLGMVTPWDALSSKMGR